MTSHLSPRPYEKIDQRLEAYRSRYMGKHLRTFLETRGARPAPARAPAARRIVEEPSVQPDAEVHALATIDTIAALTPAPPAVAPVQILVHRAAAPARRRVATAQRYLLAAAAVAAGVLLSLLALAREGTGSGGLTRYAAVGAAAPPAIAGIVRPAEDTTIAVDAAVKVEEVLVEPGRRVAHGDALFVVDDRDARMALPAARLELEDARLQVETLERTVSVDRQVEDISSRLVATTGTLELTSREAAAVPAPQVRASVVRAEAAVELAETRLQRLRQLFALGVIARQDVDHAEVAARIARDDLAVARRAEDALAEAVAAEASRARLRSELTAAQDRTERARRGAELARARIRHQRAIDQVRLLEARAAVSRIVAPSAGTVGEVRVSAGDIVAPGGVLARLADLSRLVVEVQVPSEQVPRLRLGGRADITVSALSEIRASGAIRSIEPTPGPNGTHRVVISFTPPDDVMLSGQAAAASFPDVTSSPPRP
jgi:multidrug resistance efflux pump